MDKNAIKKYAVWAREELIKRVSTKAEEYGISKENIVPSDVEAVNGHLLTKTEITQRQALISKIKSEGYEQVMEEVAYTWFNRFIALRFMEVNNYLPTHIRVFTNEQGSFDPQILTEAIHLELDGLNRDKVIALKQDNKTEELFKYLIIAQCNALSSILPGMFQKIDHYTELLFPDNILRKGSVIEQMVTFIPEEDWKDAVQIIGWLYQYYNSVPKDKVFENLKKNIKIKKEDIPAATQLFTPDWIVRYMVENSLGRLWVEGHPNEELKSNWKYYLDEAKQEADVEAQLVKLREEYKQIKPEDIKVIDPCMGSGHIIVYAFDVLMQIYQSAGWDQRDAAQSILTNNLYGLDIDDRAAQLAYFAVMMKARQYDRRILTRGIQPHVYAICESNHLDKSTLEYFTNNDPQLKKDMSTLIDELRDAKEYGSILNISPLDFSALFARIEKMNNDISMFRENVLRDIVPLIQVATVMSQKYDIVVTNPPYMGNRGMSESLSTFVQKYFPKTKNDMFSVFIERCRAFTKKDCFYSMITQPSFMFLSAFETLRNDIIVNQTISSLIHMGRGIFGIDFGSTSFVIRNSKSCVYLGTFMKLHRRTFQYIDSADIARLFLSAKSDHEYTFDFDSYKTDTDMSDNELNTVDTAHKPQKIYFTICQKEFLEIPSKPFAYWVGSQFINAFENNTIGDIANPRQGLATGCNDLFIREWYEVAINKIYFNAHSTLEAAKSKQKWFPYNKGGEFRKWYGNNDYIVNWENDGFLIKHFKNDKGKLRSRPQNTQFYFKECISWSLISSGTASFRYKPFGHIFDIGGMSCFSDDHLLYLLALSNSPIAIAALAILAPTINYQAGDIANIPVVFNEKRSITIESLAEHNIALAKSDWDAFETSWDFKRHPLLLYFISIHGASPVGSATLLYHTKKEIAADRHIEVDEGYSTKARIRTSFELWSKACNERFNTLKANEEELNRIFIDIYGLQDELTPDVADKDVTVRKADLQRDIKSLISYAVGCMFGRYSLDVEGLAYAGGEWNNEKYSTFIPDSDNIIPICDDEYFEDDITGRFVKWVETVYGKDTLEDNLRYIADALGGRGSSREVIRSYFINDFYADHLKIYQKRPIYWLFDSGKKGGFKALIYMHRYQPDTIARMRTDYVHEQQARYRTAIADLEHRISMADTAERVKLNKQLEKVRDQDAELRTYEEKIHHLADQMIRIDLDDGVKHNYEIFKDVLAPIK